MPAPDPVSDASSHVSPHAIGRRALLGLAILAVTTGGAASLLYGSIRSETTFPSDPEAAARRALLAPVTTWTRAADLRAAGSVAGGADLVVIEARALIDTKASAVRKQADDLRQFNDESRRLVMATVLGAAGGGDLDQLGHVFDGLLERGLDGVFLDCAELAASARGSNQGERLIAGLVDLIARARQVNPTFLLIIDNAPELAADPRLARVIDGVGKENLLFGIDGAGVANSRTDMIAGLHDLDPVKRAGRPVFVTEYLAEDANSARTGARQTLAALGFVGRIAAPVARR